MASNHGTGLDQVLAGFEQNLSTLTIEHRAALFMADFKGV